MRSGLEVTLLILSRMYRCGIMVIRSDFVWLSHNIKPELCPIIIVQNVTGQFMGTHVKKLLYVCEFVELFSCVRSKKAIVTSTPQRDGSIENFGPSAQEDLSPIAEVSTTNTSMELLHNNVAQFEQKFLKHESDSGEGDEDDVDNDEDNEDDEESEDGSDDGDDSENSSKDSDSEEEFEPGTDDEDEEDDESESTDMLPRKIPENGVTVNTDTQKEDNKNKSVHLRIEDINFTDSSPNIEVRNSKTTPDSSATVDVTTTEQNTDYDMVASGGNFVTCNPERSATGIDFPQYNGEKNMGSDINILKNKIESGGKKEASDNDIPDDLNEMEYFDEAHMDEDQLDERNENDIQNIDQAEEQQDDNENSTASNMDTGHEEKTSEQLNNNDSVSDTNQVDGEKGTVKNSQLVVVIKYGCK